MSKIALLVALCILVLSGCALARADLQDVALSDRLVGVLVTTQTIDLPMDVEINPDGSLKAVGEGRIYADLSGEHPVFPGVEGMALFTYRQDETSIMEGDDAIRAKMHITVSDEGESLDLSGTLYPAVRPGEVKFFFNPVHQTASGELYLVSGEGYMTDDPMLGTAFTQTMEETTTRVVNGKNETFSTKISLTVDARRVPEACALLYMDGEDKVIERQSLALNSLPNSLTVPDGCAYIIREVTTRDEAGETVTEREILDPSSATFEVDTLRGDGMIVPKTIEIVWTNPVIPA